MALSMTRWTFGRLVLDFLARDEMVSPEAKLKRYWALSTRALFPIRDLDIFSSMVFSSDERMSDRFLLLVIGIPLMKEISLLYRIRRNNVILIRIHFTSFS